MKRIATLALACTLVSCADTTAPSLRDLAMHRTLWEKRGITSYDYDLIASSEWHAEHTRRISVRNSVVTKIVDPASGDSIGPVAAGQGMTIDDLFDRAEDALQQARAEDGMHVELGFDLRLNFVTRLHADHSAWADDSYTYVVTNFARR